jgi:hypothetical protein
MAIAQPASYGGGSTIVVQIDHLPAGSRSAPLGREEGGNLEVSSMIARAEAACDRYQQAVSEPGLGALALRKRRDNLRAMERVLARLRNQDPGNGR